MGCGTMEIPLCRIPECIIETKEESMKKYVFSHKWMLAATVLFRCLEAGLQVFTSVAIMGIFDATIDGNFVELKKWLIITGVIFAAFAACVLLSNLMLYKYLQKTMYILKKDVFRGILRKSYKSFKSNNTADYISNLTNDINLVENNYIITSIARIGDYIILLLSIIVLLCINGWITLLTLAVSIFVLFAPMFFQKPLEKRQGEVSKQFSVFTDKIKDIFMGYEVIKTFSAEKLKEKEFLDENKELEYKKFASNKIISYATATSGALGIFVQIVIVAFAAVLVINGHITAGSLVAVLQLSGQVIAPFMNIVDKTNKINSMGAINEKLLALANTEAEEGKQPLVSFEKALKVSDLCYAYEEGKTILTNFSYEFEKGKKYAIVGRSGGGKSTLLQLIMGYDDAYEGQILIDDQELKEVSSESKYTALTIMHQHVYMFNNSLMDNITFGRNYDKDLLEKKLAESGVAEFLGSISDATMEDIGESGNKLSGGQRQRIAIARALINGSQILLLDEAMSSLDPQNAKEIESWILSQEQLTVISVTHKLESEELKKYDEILVLDNGCVAESGNYDELIRKDGLFSKMRRNELEGT